MSPELPHFDSYGEAAHSLGNAWEKYVAGLSVFATQTEINEGVAEMLSEKCGDELIRGSTVMDMHIGKDDHNFLTYVDFGTLHAATGYTLLCSSLNRDKLSLPEIEPAIIVRWGNRIDHSWYWNREIAAAIGPRVKCNQCGEVVEGRGKLSSLADLTEKHKFSLASVCSDRCAKLVEEESYRRYACLEQMEMERRQELRNVRNLKSLSSRLRSALRKNDLPALKSLRREFEDHQTLRPLHQQ